MKQEQHNERRRRAKDIIEQWKAIPGYEGLYEVSDMGAVRSLRHSVPCRGGKTRMAGGWNRKLVLATNGYYMVCLRRIGQPAKFCTVHSLVLAAFVGPRPEGNLCCHNDGVKTHNTLNNLRYDTPQNNEADKLTHGTRCFGERSHGAKLTDEYARSIRENTDGLSQRALAARFGVTQATISYVVKGRGWRHVQ